MSLAPLRRKTRLISPGRKVARVGRPAVRDDIPSSFLQGLKDIAAGRVVDMEKALHEPHPG
jgi:predicted transcriptional regulator